MGDYSLIRIRNGTVLFKFYIARFKPTLIPGNSHDI